MKKKLLKATFFQCIYVVNYIYCFSPINQKKKFSDCTTKRWEEKSSFLLMQEARDDEERETKQKT